jgi:hypothetical protein
MDRLLEEAIRNGRLSELSKRPLTPPQRYLLERMAEGDIPREGWAGGTVHCFDRLVAFGFAEYVPGLDVGRITNLGRQRLADLTPRR